jgi:hypothetical protein
MSYILEAIPIIDEQFSYLSAESKESAFPKQNALEYPAQQEDATKQPAPYHTIYKLSIAFINTLRPLSSTPSSTNVSLKIHATSLCTPSGI